MRFLFVLGMIGFFTISVSGMDEAASKWVNAHANGGWASSVKDAVMGAQYSALRDNALFKALYSEGMQTVYSKVFEAATGGMPVPLQLMHIGREVAPGGLCVMHVCQYAIMSYRDREKPSQAEAIVCSTIGDALIRSTCTRYAVQSPLSYFGVPRSESRDCAVLVDMVFGVLRYQSADDLEEHRHDAALSGEGTSSWAYHVGTQKLMTMLTTELGFDYPDLIRRLVVLLVDTFAPGVRC